MEIEPKIDRNILGRLSDCKFVGIVGEPISKDLILFLRLHQPRDGVSNSDEP
jgi:hypothetical protein